MSLTRFSAGDIVVSTDALVTSTWSDNTNNLQVAFTSSQNGFKSQTSSGWFHFDVYNQNATGSDAEVQYSVGYGNRVGSGSPDFTNDSGSHGMNASRATYGAYRNLVFGDETQNFQFHTHTPDDIYVININRARYKQSLKPGTLNLQLSASLHNSPTTPTIIRLTDDSVTTKGSAKLTNLGRQFNIVSGNSGIMKGTTLQQTDSGSFGLFYPDAGVIILNPDAFGQNPPLDLMVGGLEKYGVSAAAKEDSGSFLTPNRRTGDLSNYNGQLNGTGAGLNEDGNNGYQNNPEMLMRAISGAGNFIVDSQEKITSQYYFARAKNFEYNYTINPSFTDTRGNLNFSSMINNPVTYITTVGLYNDSSELVAVAKLSQPVVKDFTKEALIRVKLDY